MSKKRAPYIEVPQKWREEALEALRSNDSDSIDRLYHRWCQMGYTPNLVARSMELPYIVLELSDVERVRLAEAIRRLDQGLQTLR